MGTKPRSYVLRLPEGTYLWAVYVGLSLVDAGREVYADAAGQRADGAAWAAARNLADTGSPVVHSPWVGRTGPRPSPRNEA